MVLATVRTVTANRERILNSNLDLTASLDALERAATNLPSSPANRLPDFVLYAYLTDVREHARAVALIASSPAPRAAFVNARAALESAIDAVFLVSDESAYAYRGAQARVAELLETEELERRAAPLNPPIPESAPRSISAEDAMLSDARSWDEDAPGRGDMLRRAFDAHNRTKGALRAHWSLLPQKDVYAAVFPGEEADSLGEMSRVIHGILSMASHARPRVGSREITASDDGRITLRTRGTDAEMARQIAAFACLLANEALRRHREFAVEDPV